LHKFWRLAFPLFSYRVNLFLQQGCHNFKPKLPNWVNLRVSCYARCWYMYIFHGHLVYLRLHICYTYFMFIWFILWKFGVIFPVLVWINKNLATLQQVKNRLRVFVFVWVPCTANLILKHFRQNLPFTEKWTIFIAFFNLGKYSWQREINRDWDTDRLGRHLEIYVETDRQTDIIGRDKERFVETDKEIKRSR
jgi:hypothetical protein